MKRIAIVVIVLALAMPWTAEAREGWYFDFTAGPGVHVDLEHARNDFPDGVEAPAEVTFLNELDFGYSFEGPFTLGVGIEANNFVDLGYKLDFKWSFLEGGDLQPYTYLCLHGGITDVVMGALHLGFGADLFVTDQFYLILDIRTGPSIVSADPPRDPVTDEREYHWHMEGALSFGFGYMFGSGSKR